MRLALYQPDIPQNLGAVIRLSACFQTPVDIIEPCGFPLTDKALRRAAMDYGALADLSPHPSLEAFRAARRTGRFVLIETDGATPLHAFRFRPDDTLILGRESAGSPPELYTFADAVVRIPIAAAARSLNVAMAAAIALAEALRQTGGLPSGG